MQQDGWQHEEVVQGESSQHTGVQQTGLQHTGVQQTGLQHTGVQQTDLQHTGVQQCPWQGEEGPQAGRQQEPVRADWQGLHRSVRQGAGAQHGGSQQLSGQSSTCQE